MVLDVAFGIILAGIICVVGFAILVVIFSPFALLGAIFDSMSSPPSNSRTNEWNWMGPTPMNPADNDRIGLWLEKWTRRYMRWPKP
jgi:hypothetical protein